jgi:SAM-dependent methyltransferase
MTKKSVIELQTFLINHQADFFDEMRIADYGGTDNIGRDIVKILLASGNLENYHMLDFDNGIDLREPIKGEKFDLGICMDLLEHVSNPFIVVKNIIDSLNPGAFLFVTAPFVWELHGYPQDFWRFTPDGFAELFKEMKTEIIYIEVDDYEITEKSTPPVNPPWTRVIGIFQKK